LQAKRANHSKKKERAAQRLALPAKDGGEPEMFFWRNPLSDADGSPDTAGTIFCPVHAVLGGLTNGTRPQPEKKTGNGMVSTTAGKAPRK
jgi:hypothetical protein